MKTATGSMMMFAAPCPLRRKQATHVKGNFRSIAVIAAVSLFLTWPEPGKAQCPVDLSKTTPLTASDLTSQATVDSKFAARRDAANQSNLNVKKGLSTT